MRAARFYAAGDVRIDEVPVPQPQEDQVIIDVEWGGICGTDLHEYAIGPLVIPSKQPHPQTGETLPVTLCHEFCGHISQVPSTGIKAADGTALKEGMPVMVDPRISCGTCELCKAGNSNLCSQWGFLGLSGAGGGFAEKVAVKANKCYPLPADVNLADAAIIEPLAVARHGLNVSGIAENEWNTKHVLVIGGGPVGQAVLCSLRALNAKMALLTEPAAERRRQCSSLCDAVFDPLNQKIPEECRQLTPGKAGVDVVIDCAGIAPGMADGVAALRPRGVYVNVASWEKDFVVPFYQFIMKELTLKMSMAYNEKDFADTVRDFCAGKYKGAEKMVTARIVLEDVKEKGFDTLLNQKDKHVKVLVTSKRELLKA